LQSSYAGHHEGQRLVEQAWNEINIDSQADSISEIFHGMKHIIEVDHHKIYAEHHQSHGWLVPEDFRSEYFYPNRELGDHAIVTLIRGDYSSDEYIFTRNEFGGDAVYVATNNADDALMIALKYK